MTARPGLSIAPMMGYTDRHGRYFLRRLSRFARLYSEMIPAQAILHGDRDRLLRLDACEHPVALQLGGGDAAALAEAARIGAGYGYDEINLNLGCPSARVGEGGFGACLMKQPRQAAHCVRALCDAVSVPVSVKCRIGVDEQEPQRDFLPFIDRLADAGCRIFIVHARKAWLQGLSPKQNRTLPPLDYNLVHDLKAQRPGLAVHLNGGIENLQQARAALGRLDGVMIGRAAFADPWMLTQADRLWHGAAAAPPTRAAILEDMLAYAVARARHGDMPRAILRHCMTLYRGVAGSKAFRRRLSGLMRAPVPADWLASLPAAPDSLVPAPAAKNLPPAAFAPMICHAPRNPDL